MEVPLFELLVVLIIILLGGFLAFLSSLITDISQEKINELLDKKYKAAQIYQNLRLQFEQNVSPFQIAEIILYSVGAIAVGITLANMHYDLKIIIAISTVYIILILLVRYTFQAIGIRIVDDVASIWSSALKIIYITFKPIYFIIALITKKIIGQKTDEDSKDEIENAVESAYSDNTLDQDEYKMLKNTINFSEITVHEVMTPRTVIFSVDIMSKVKDIVDKPELQNYSRFPIWEGESIDNGVQGYVMTRDIYYAALNGKEETRLDDYLREIRFVNETDTLDEVLERFIGSNKHMSMVVDEYGAITGLVTMEDIFESLIGEEIVDEVDKNVDMRQLAMQIKEQRITKL